MLIEFFVIPFWSEIIGVNQTRAACSSQFRITRIIWDHIQSTRFQVALLILIVPMYLKTKVISNYTFLVTRILHFFRVSHMFYRSTALA